MSGWSVLYKTASGSHHVRCSNGLAMAVRSSAKAECAQRGQLDPAS
jgi:hypothetical protein